MAVRDIFGKPVLPRRLVICTGPCCDHLGLASAHLEALLGMLAERALSETLVLKGSCVRRSCLGKCSGEPVARVEPDDVWYRDLSPEILLRIFEEHVLEGKEVSEFVLVEDNSP